MCWCWLLHRATTIVPFIGTKNDDVWLDCFGCCKPNKYTHIHAHEHIWPCNFEECACAVTTFMLNFYNCRYMLAMLLLLPLLLYFKKLFKLMNMWVVIELNLWMCARWAIMHFVALYISVLILMYVSTWTHADHVVFFHLFRASTHAVCVPYSLHNDGGTGPPPPPISRFHSSVLALFVCTACCWSCYCCCNADAKLLSD